MSNAIEDDDTPQRVALGLQIIGRRDDQSAPLLLTSAMMALGL
jgi:hypothetical protein